MAREKESRLMKYQFMNRQENSKFALAYPTTVYHGHWPDVKRRVSG